MACVGIITKPNKTLSLPRTKAKLAGAIKNQLFPHILYMCRNVRLLFDDGPKINRQ